MNRKGIVKSDEKQKAIMKDDLVKTNHLPYKWSLNQGFLCEEDGGAEVDRGSGGAKEDIRVY